MKIFIIFFFFLAQTSAHAGTYNFYFNNTEQGDNSTAAPNVIVKDDKGNVVTPEAASSNETPSATTAAPAASPEPTAAGTTVMDRIMNTDFPAPQWRLAFGAIKNSRGFLASDITYRDRGYVSTYSQGSLFYFIKRNIGLGFQVGRFLGPEAVYNPFGVRQGFGKINFEISTAILSDLRNDSKRDLYIGGQVSLNVIKDLGLGFALRFTPYESDDFIKASANWNMHLLF